MKDLKNLLKFAKIGIAVSIIIIISGFSKYNEASLSYYRTDEANNAKMWIVIGAILLLLSIVALILGYINPEGLNEKLLKSNSSQKCLNCGTISTVDNKFCPKCGNDMTKQINIKSQESDFQ